MKNSNFTEIGIVENFILGGDFTPSLLGKNLQQLRILRKEHYQNLIENKKSNQDELDFIDEYDNYCKFYNSLICSKKLAPAIFSRMIQEFLNDYDIVKPMDINKSAYMLTLDTLNSLKTHLNNSNNKMRNYMLKGINNSIKAFEENNKTAEELNK